MPIPTGYRAARSGPAAPVRADWAAAFGSAELNRLVAGALAENFDIAVAVAQIQQAEAQAVVTRSALYPTLDATQDTSRTQTSGARGSTVTKPITANSGSLGLSASYVLDLFGKNGFAARAQDQVAQATVFDRDSTALATVASVVNTYFLVVASQDRLRVAEEDIQVAGRVLDAIRGRQTFGTGSGLDVAQQESTLATQRARVPPLRQQVQQNRNVLAVLLGRTPESVSVRGGSLDGLRVPSVRAGLPSALLLRRPDIAAAEANLASAEASVASARAAFFPSIQLTAGGGLESAALKSLFGPNALFFSLASGITQPIFDGYALRGQFDLQKGRSAEYAATYKKTIVQSFADVENALVAIRENTEYERREREAVVAARRALDLAEGQLRLGTTDIVTLSTIQTTLFNAQDAAVQARYQKFLAYVSLYQALGGGWTRERNRPIAQIADAVGQP